MKLNSISLLALAIAGAGFSTPAFAQTAPDEGDGQDIIVTGTRDKGIKVGDSVTPIAVISADTLKRIGSTDLNTALGANLPQVQVQAFGNDQTAFHPSIKLRGLSANQTLVLVNGKRRHGTANVVVTNALWTGGAAPDMGLLPSDSIDHIEVLTDGAAAQYGTDAIAGVVNLILKKNSSGGTINATAGQYIEGDGLTWDIMGNIGLEPIPDMYLSLTAERKFHDYSFRGDLDPRVVDTGQSTSANTGNNGGRTLLARYPGLTSAENYPYVNRIFGDGKMNLTNAMYNMGYTGIPNIEIYSFGTYSRRVGYTYQNFRLPNVVYGKSATPNVATPTGDIPFPQGFSPQEGLKETDYAATGGVSGNFGKTTFDLSVTYGRDFNAIYVTNSANAALYYDSSACLPGPAPNCATSKLNGYTPRDVHDGDFIGSQLTAALDLTHKLDVGLAEPVNIAGGLEFRRETYELRAGELASYYTGTGTLGGGIQSFFGYAPANASKNSRTDFSQYLDVSMKPVTGLSLDAAVRHEHYSDFGDTTVFKGSGRWDISPQFAIRGSGSTGFRAPTLAEGFYSGINVSVASLSGIFAPNSAGAASLGIGGLKPEKSTNFSVGFVFRPDPKLTVTVDAYSIYIRDRIVQSAGFSGYSNNCKYLPAGYTAGMDVNAAYNAWIAAKGTCTGIISPNVLTALASNGVPITSVISTINSGASGSLNINTFVNGVNTLTHGVDFQATYDMNLGPDLGKIAWTLAATYNKNKVNKVASAPSGVNQAQGIFDKYSISSITDTSPKWRATLNMFWQMGIHGLNIREAFYGPTAQLATTPANGSIDYWLKVNTRFLTDIEYSIKPLSFVKLSVGAQNVFNTYPNKYPYYIRQQQYALSSTAYVVKYPTFSPVGVMGGYYYGRIGVTF